MTVQPSSWYIQASDGKRRRARGGELPSVSAGGHKGWKQEYRRPGEFEGVGLNDNQAADDREQPQWGGKAGGERDGQAVDYEATAAAEEEKEDEDAVEEEEEEEEVPRALESIDFDIDSGAGSIADSQVDSDRTVEAVRAMPGASQANIDLAARGGDDILPGGYRVPPASLLKRQQRSNNADLPAEGSHDDDVAPMWQVSGSSPFIP